MIDSQYFRTQWIEQLRETYPKTDPLLLERTIYAFELLGLLAQTDTEFVFKGGTSLMMLMDNPKRLSIDIDILGQFTLEELQSLAEDSPFESVDEQDRKSRDIPKRHFKFYYDSALDRDT